MIVLGIVLLLLGWLTGIGILNTLGVLLVIVGVVLLLISAFGHPVGGRKWWY